MLESGRCRGKCRRCRVESTGCGGQVTEDGSIRVRTWASTYVLRPCQGTGVSLISEEISRGDTRGLYCHGRD